MQVSLNNHKRASSKHFDALGAYGGALVDTPSIDRLAAGRVQFCNRMAHKVEPLPERIEAW